MQAENGAPSSEHAKLTPASLSEKVKLALVELVGLAGPEPIVGGGGVAVATVHV